MISANIRKRCLRGRHNSRVRHDCRTEEMVIDMNRPPGPRSSIGNRARGAASQQHPDVPRFRTPIRYGNYD